MICSTNPYVHTLTFICIKNAVVFLVIMLTVAQLGPTKEGFYCCEQGKILS